MKCILPALLLAMSLSGAAYDNAEARSSVRIVDGDTIELYGETVRIANIDTPETTKAKCPEERAKGEAASLALADLLGRGAVTLQRGDPKSKRKTDRYGRTLGLVFVDGHDVGELLIAMGHARRWTGKRRPWCNRAG